MGMPTIADTRHLEIEGLYNARDLGGHPTPHGPTRRRAVVRSEAPTSLTETGRSQLAEHGVTAYLDLRSDEEAGEEPSPFAGSRWYRRVPLLDHTALLEVRELRRSEDLMRHLLFRRAEMVGEALLTLLDLAQTGGVLVHCRAGKDRTGLLAALLLANAGVEPTAVAVDHAHSQSRLEPLFAIWAARAGSDEERALISMRRFERTPQSMLVTLAELDARHAGVGGYLRFIGLLADEVAALQLVLVESRRSAHAVA